MVVWSGVNTVHTRIEKNITCCFENRPWNFYASLFRTCATTVVSTSKSLVTAQLRKFRVVFAGVDHGADVLFPGCAPGLARRPTRGDCHAAAHVGRLQVRRVANTAHHLLPHSAGKCESPTLPTISYLTLLVSVSPQTLPTISYLTLLVSVSLRPQRGAIGSVQSNPLNWFLSQQEFRVLWTSCLPPKRGISHNGSDTTYFAGLWLTQV